MTTPLSLLSGSRQNALESQAKFSSFEVGVQKVPSPHYPGERHVLDGRIGNGASQRERELGLLWCLGTVGREGATGDR